MFCPKGFRQLGCPASAFRTKQAGRGGIDRAEAGVAGAAGEPVRDVKVRGSTRRVGGLQNVPAAVAETTETTWETVSGPRSRSGATAVTI